MEVKFREQISKLLSALIWRKQRINSRLRGLLVRYTILILGGECGCGILVSSGFQFKYPPHKGIKIGNNCSFGKNITIDVPAGGELTISDRCSFTMDIIISAVERVEIGKDTQVAEFTSIRDADHGIVLGIPINNQQLQSEPITIGNDVWLGRGVVVLKGAKIRDGAVIGANAVVKGVVEENGIAVGVPAKVIRSRCGSSN